MSQIYWWEIQIGLCPRVWNLKNYYIWQHGSCETWKENNWFLRSTNLFLLGYFTEKCLEEKGGLACLCLAATGMSGQNHGFLRSSSLVKGAGRDCTFFWSLEMENKLRFQAYIPFELVCYETMLSFWHFWKIVSLGQWLLLQHLYNVVDENSLSKGSV